MSWLALGWFLTLSGGAAQPRGFDSIGGDVGGLEALWLAGDLLEERFGSARGAGLGLLAPG